ncbi:hypothetical protein [Photobacterium piscicola]|uniref:hypothetical protein n=1 Tax=Photobacterium piscicola TaxID=1378299 RepID=UPI0038D20912
MSINFDIVIESDDYTAEMSAGLETLVGASDATSHIAHALLLGRVARKLKKEKSRISQTMLGTFQGSYGLNFCIGSEDIEIKQKINDIGHEVFAELTSYFINEALYLETNVLSPKAEKILINLGEDIPEQLVSQLQKSSLHKLHSYSKNFGKKVKLRYKKNKATQVTLANIDQKSYLSLVPNTDLTKVVIDASITRFNINTGNGRLYIKGADGTVAFGFTNKYKEIKHHAKKMFTNNLDKCNGTPNDNWDTLTLSCTTLRNGNGAIVKYLVQGVE